MDTGLTDRPVLVTGATANIGRAIAMAFAGEGAKVAVVGRDATAGRVVVDRALEAGAADAVFIAADVTDYDQVRAMAEAALNRFGHLDVLVNNVGGNVDVGPFAGSEPAQWRADIDITLMSVLNCTRVFLPGMIARQWGRVINIGSMSGVVGDPYLAIYSAAKAGVHGFTRVLSVEVGPANVTVNAIAPYATGPDDPDEPMSLGSRSHPTRGVFRTLPPDKAALLGSIFAEGVLPQKRAKGSQVGASAVFLASEAAGYITGETLHVDGGVRWA